MACHCLDLSSTPCPPSPTQTISLVARWRRRGLVRGLGRCAVHATRLGDLSCMCGSTSESVQSFVPTTGQVSADSGNELRRHASRRPCRTRGPLPTRRVRERFPPAHATIAEHHLTRRQPPPCKRVHGAAARIGDKLTRLNRPGLNGGPDRAKRSPAGSPRPPRPATSKNATGPGPLHPVIPPHSGRRTPGTGRRPRPPRRRRFARQRLRPSRGCRCRRCGGRPRHGVASTSGRRATFGTEALGAHQCGAALRTVIRHWTSLGVRVVLLNRLNRNQPGAALMTIPEGAQ